MNARAPEWRVRLLLAAVSSAVTLFGAEALARILLRSPPSERAPGTPISELSPTLGWRTRPTGSQRIKRGEFAVTISINGQGLRGPEIAYRAAPGVRRLAIMGDSFAHGYYADEPSTLRGRLGVALQGCAVEALNAGSPGYSTDQEWLYFAEEISKYQPSEIVLLFYYNDLFFNLEPMGTGDRAKPVFEERGGVLVARPPAAKGVGPRRLQGEGGPEPVAQVRSAPTFHHSALWAFAAERLQRRRPDWQRRLSRAGLMPDLSVSPPAEFVPFGPKGDAERGRVEAMWKQTEELLRLFREDVRRSDAGFSVFYVPARFEVNDAAWQFVQRRYEADRPWQRDVVRQRLASVLTRLDIPMVEAGGEFARAERSARPAYFALDGHWNDRGNEIAFDALLPAMRRAFSCAS